MTGMRRQMSRTTLVALALAAAAALPAAAGAATVTVDAPCYRQGTRVNFTLTGFTPSELVTLNYNGGLLDAVQVGIDGTYAGSFSAGSTSDGEIVHTTQLVAADPQGNAGAAPVRVSVPYVSVKPTNVTPSKKATIRVSGFFDVPLLYAHYAYTKSDVNHPLKKTIKLGRPQGPCGTLSYRGKLLPFSKPKSGVWEIQVDGRSAFKRQLAPYAATTTFVAPKRKG
jgi:hypothetical protein